MSEAKKDRVIVALDTDSLDRVKQLTADLKGAISFYKVGFELFSAHGWTAVEMIKKTGARVFLDLKYHDIPNTVAKAAKVVCDHGVDMFNVHALGGSAMLQAAAEAVRAKTSSGATRPILIAVTVLTSHQQQDLHDDLGISGKLEDRVLHFARLAKQSGLDGVVSSPKEIALLRNDFSDDFQIVTPGIRPKESGKDDQKRTLTPEDAFEQGASYIVVGRPITAAEEPRKKADAILLTLR